MDRRAFLRYPMTGALWLTVGSTGLLRPRTVWADPMPDIAVVKGTPGPATRAAVGLLGGITTVVKPGHRVVIKPNMSFASGPEAGANTHPEVIKTLAAMCWEAGASSVLVLDHTLSPAGLCLERSGIASTVEAVKPRTVFTINDSDHYREVPIPGGRTLKSTEVATEVLRADVLIAAPTAKSHSGAGVSLSLKGMMGLVYNRGAMHWKGLDTCIVDLCTVLKADLVVLDGTHVLSTGGPRGPGRVLNANTVIASRDMVAADAYGVSAFEWYGKRFAPRQVGHVREAHQRGLGRMDFENLRVETLTL